jgi:protein-S-isoprenylcysteine O-methyltransferase Ste14
MLALPSTHMIWWLLRVICITMFVMPLILLRVPSEEAMLRQQFSSEWPHYIRTCPWKIIPGIY